jgi:hypothetical protein
MRYIPIIEALEKQLQKHPQLRELRYYRFSIPSSSVKNPFICIPFTQTNEYTSHVHPLNINVKYIDTPDIPDYNWIEELLGPEVEEG